VTTAFSKKAPKGNRNRNRNHRLLQERKPRVLKRFAQPAEIDRDVPMMTATNIHYELADRAQGLSAGGIGAVLMVTPTTGLIGDMTKTPSSQGPSPYHESDQVLNIAFNLLAGGQRMEHIELRRNDEVFLSASGAQRIPDPTTEWDFCRRLTEHDVLTLMDAINQSRLRVWSQQPSEFFAEAVVEVDGTAVATDAEYKEGVDIAYNVVMGLPSPGGLAGQHRRTDSRSRGIDAARQFDQPLLQPHQQVINMGGLARGFVCRHLADGKLLLLAMPSEMGTVSSAPFFNCSRRRGSNITATLFPICSHSGQIGMLQFAVSI
jgi:hypothetical protein